MNPLNKNLCILVSLDGWGIAPPGPGNAVSLAKTINMNKFWASYPHTQLGASGESVGLPRGEDGNSETGHINMGAGKIVYQYLARINMSIADGTFFTSPVLLGAIEHVKKNNSKLHFMGLVGSGGVHSNIEHLFALIHLASSKNVEKVFIHAFTDGRDSPPTSGISYIQKIKEHIEKEKVGKIASVMGRYWAMDRDRRWDRTAKAYFALTKGEGRLIKSIEDAITESYSRGLTDEFIEPMLMADDENKPIGLIEDGDAVVFFNFRIDRPRQLSRAFVVQDELKDGEWGFDPYSDLYSVKKDNGKPHEGSPMFQRGKKLENIYFVLMTEYEKILIKHGARAIFSPETISMPLGRVLSLNDVRQIRVAESEKERFVTYHFNGRREDPFPGEDRVIIPSPKVPTYDLKPEMSSYEITDALLSRLSDGVYSFAFINYAAPDMVGHTGNIDAAIKAVSAVDECVGKLCNFALGYGGTVILTADHGNVEEMIDLQTGEVDTEHSTNPVPFIVVSKEFMSKPFVLTSGILADVAPSVLGVLGIDIPSEMTGRDLLKDIRDPHL